MEHSWVLQGWSLFGSQRHSRIVHHFQHVLKNGKVYHGVRAIKVAPEKYGRDPAYRRRINELLAFCGITARDIAGMAESGKWTTYGICACHWPLESFYMRANGTVGLLDEARPAHARELAAVNRVHVDLRARAHADPLSAMAANMEDTERGLRDAKGEIAKLVYVVLPSRCGSLRALLIFPCLPSQRGARVAEDPAAGQGHAALQGAHAARRSTPWRVVACSFRPRRVPAPSTMASRTCSPCKVSSAIFVCVCVCVF